MGIVGITSFYDTKCEFVRTKPTIDRQRLRATMNKQTTRKPTGAAALGPGPGRPKGSVNKATKTFRETVTALLEGNADNVQKWLETVAYGDGDQVRPDPKGALTLLAQLAEYATPKLARTELAGDQDAPIKATTKVEYVVMWEGGQQHPKQ